MDRVDLDLATIVQHEIEDYADGDWWKASAYAVCDTTRHVYAVLVVPDHPRKFQAGIVVMARVVNDHVVIDHDTTDRPFVDALVEAGIPREKIICLYAGEPVRL